MIAVLAAALLLPATAASPVDDRAATVIAAERAFAKAAVRDGQWTAFRAYAAPDALMFVPQPVNAQSWLRDRPDPPRSVQWQPHRVILSCDGTLAATSGAARWPDGGHGQFVTIWRRDPDGGWKWVADAGDRVDRPLVASPAPIVETADCPGAAGPDRADPDPGRVGGASADGTFAWAWVDGPQRRGLRVSIFIGTRFADAILPVPRSPAADAAP